MKTISLFVTCLLALACTQEETGKKTIWYCSECCDSLSKPIEHPNLSKLTCEENNSNGINGNTWTWKSKEVKDCGNLPCAPDNP
jgi:hypothetical protein